MIPDWVDHYVYGTSQDKKDKAFGLIKKKLGEFDNLAMILKEVIRKCSSIDNELNEDSFEKLKIAVVNDYGFKVINPASKFRYVIYIPQFAAKETEELMKHKIAHEIAHFFFTLKNGDLDNSEGIECNKKTVEWGFPEPKNK